MKTTNAIRKPLVAVLALCAAGITLWPAANAAAQSTTPASFPAVARVVGYLQGLSGRDLNGVALNGVVLDGRRVAGVSLVGVELNGAPMQATWLDGTKLAGIKSNGNPAQGNKFVDAVFSATLDNGETLPLRIDAIEKGTGPTGKHIQYYEVSYDTVDSWEPLCGLDDDGLPILAIPLNGRWDLNEGTPTGGSKINDPESFTFACQGFALAKCVEAGYRPWETVKVCTPGHGCEMVSLASYHQACTRMIRADFCGDGTSYTENGVLVNLYDGLGIRVDSESWAFEAEWDEDGAICAVRDRIADVEPACLDDLEEDGCGYTSHFADGTILFSEVVL